MSKTIQMKFAATVAYQETTKKYAAIIFNAATGEPMDEPVFCFDTVEQAQEAGSKIISKTIEKLRARGMKAYRPGS